MCEAPLVWSDVDDKSSYKVYKTTPEWTRETVPRAILRAHTTRAGTWGRICVREGALVYRVLEPTPRETRLDPSRMGWIEPQVPHEVELCGPVRFYIEFMRREDVS